MFCQHFSFCDNLLKCICVCYFINQNWTQWILKVSTKGNKIQWKHNLYCNLHLKSIYYWWTHLKLEGKKKKKKKTQTKQNKTKQPTHIFKINNRKAPTNSFDSCAICAWFQCLCTQKENSEIMHKLEVNHKFGVYHKLCSYRYKSRENYIPKLTAKILSCQEQSKNWKSYIKSNQKKWNNKCTSQVCHGYSNESCYIIP